MNTNPNAKRILCYGDSYTWGNNPAIELERFPADVRWTGVLQGKLGEDYEVIEEGLNSRTLFSDDPRPGKEGCNGGTYFPVCMDTHFPLDLVILLLGSNQIKDVFDSSLEDIAKSVEEDYVKVVLDRKSQFRNSAPKLLLISPPILDLSIDYAFQRYSKSAKKNRALAGIYQKIADKYSIPFFDAADYVKVGEDGVHLDAENNRILGEIVYSRVVEI